MRSKSGSRRMLTIEQANERAREPLLALVMRRQASYGSRMAAYEAVGSSIGRSGSWVRKIIGRSSEVTVGLHDWLNINAICARLDAYSERLEHQTATIRGDAIEADHQLSGSSHPSDVEQGVGASEGAAR